MRKLLPTALMILAGAFSAQAGTYYMTDLFTDATAYIIDLSTGNVTPFSTFLGASPIAVSDAVRIGALDGSQAAAYTSSGSLIGPLFSGASDPSLSLLDGTTDGVHNYAVGSGGVYIADRDWQNLRLLFSSDVLFGITYDPITNSLFVSQGNGLVQYDLSGNPLSSSAIASGFATGLAYDQGTDSLWYFDNTSANARFVNINRDGSLTALAPVIIPDFSPFGWGGEMPITFNTASAVPEPGAWLLGLSGFGGLALWRRKRSR